MKAIGLGLLAVGTLIMLFGLVKSGAAEYSDTLNVGLLTEKTNLVLVGGFAQVIGAIFQATSSIMERLGASASASAITTEGASS